jgi:hypothetical protein
MEEMKSDESYQAMEMAQFPQQDHPITVVISSPPPVVTPYSNQILVSLTSTTGPRHIIADARSAALCADVANVSVGLAMTGALSFFGVQSAMSACGIGVISGMAAQLLGSCDQRNLTAVHLVGIVSMVTTALTSTLLAAQPAAIRYPANMAIGLASYAGLRFLANSRSQVSQAPVAEEPLIMSVELRGQKHRVIRGS